MAVEEISFTPKRDDVFRVQALHMERQQSLAYGNTYGSILIGLAFAVPIATYLLVSLLGFEGNNQDDAALAATFAFTTGVLVHYLLVGYLHREAARRMIDATPSLFAPQHIALSENGLETTSTGFASATVQWNAIDDAHIHESDILVWQGPNLLCWIPLKAFARPEDGDAFVRQISTLAAIARGQNADPL